MHHKEHLTQENIWDLKVNLNPENLISLCRECHRKHHEQDKAEGHRKYYKSKQSACAEGYHFDETGQLVPD
ncbi:MAG: hypothetical protein IK121_03035 [Lachnospiraceae bacterium]|nr:hypothetical protein [Lachnospiraceae bacterium]